MRLGGPLPPAFYDRDAAAVARDLLGAVLRHDSDEGVISGRIVETEAYLGPHDPASHSAVGRTARTWHMFGPPGTAYVYFIYGMHWCVNAVTREEGYGSAVLIRAVQPLEGVPLMRRRRLRARSDRDLANGPGKVCAAFGITRAHDGLLLTGGSRLTIGAGETVCDDAVAVTPRIGIRKAVEWPLRFVVTAAR
ncbi:MAG: DNA-3-methyladenine glycosylase [Gemmatimonas sp.]|uniref:DNA-3-methyladenine glycosylase n=1 Tax=Gemmatimonas sp. TaxID=1962908 RepID=UPI00391F0A46|nr:DNA-3-methyladenine glycosylase [Gemmatimonadota bacterium]